MSNLVKKQKNNRSLLLFGLIALILSAIVVFKQGFPYRISKFVGNNVQAAGFDQYGYNYQARLFNGTLSQWCQKRGFPLDFSNCGVYGFGSVNDKLVMKWNAEWDRGNAEGWAKPPYNAWTDNEWNGRVDGGSGVVWHYKIVWDKGCTDNGTPSANGSYCLWGQFAVVMDQGSDKSGTNAAYCSNTALSTNKGGHGFCALGSPAGYGAYFAH